MHLDITIRERKSDEGLKVISRLWSGEVLDYAGRTSTFPQASSAPAARADLPMWIGRVFGTRRFGPDCTGRQAETES